MSSKLRQQQPERAAAGYRILRSLLFLDWRRFPCGKYTTQRISFIVWIVLIVTCIKQKARENPAKECRCIEWRNCFP